MLVPQHLHQTYNQLLQPSSKEGGSYLNALCSEEALILYTEDSMCAAAYHYRLADLLTAVTTSSKGVGSSKKLPPTLSRQYLFVDMEVPSILRYFEASDIWHGAGISCLSTLYRPSATTEGPHRRLFIAHHYFSSNSSPDLPLVRKILSPLSNGDVIRVNERGVELMVLGIYGRHIAWLVDSEDRFRVKTTSFAPLGYLQEEQHVSEMGIQFEEEVYGAIDSMELDDAFGILYFTTSKGVYRVNLC